MSEASTSNSNNTVIDTIQSLVVAFSLAMIFRGFIIESFVIPTGSMAPTLLGLHWQIDSAQTGGSTAVGLDTGGARPDARRLRDHLAGRQQPLGRENMPSGKVRSGDRILVSKTLYPFVLPNRWDVMVFKNPPTPEGATANYIKRLVGLPGESIWLVDGDVFVKDEGADDFMIARKPAHVRNAVWQTIYDSNNTPVDPERLSAPWTGQPWTGRPPGAWRESNRTMATDSSGPTTLTWDDERFPLDDWNAYNMLTPVAGDLPVSDLRMSATLTPGSDALDATLTLTARSHVITFSIAGSTATVMIDDGEDQMSNTGTLPESMQAGRPLRIVSEHVDQSLHMTIDGVEVVTLEYDWTPRQRLEFASGMAGSALSDGELSRRRPVKPTIQWRFTGSPVSMSNVQLDRDLYYRPGLQTSVARRHEPAPEFADQVRPGGPAAAVHPDTVVTLTDEQFFMLGDNSGRSLDGRLWGAPAPIVAEQIDPTPFVVNGDLLVGQAFAVYWPAPYSVTDGSMNIIPDFGKIRFIH